MLWILLIVGGALLFLFLLLLILLRVFRDSKSPASEPIVMRPGPIPAEPATPTAPGAAAATATAVGSADAPATAPNAAEMMTAATLAAIPSPVLKPGYLTLASDPSRRFDITGERFTIGRAEGNSLVIGDDFTDGDTVSRFHAAIYPQAGKMMIEDLNSHNGVWVNGQAIPKIALSDGAEIAAGGVTFIYHAGDAAGEEGDSAK